MPFVDLREWLSALEKAGELQRIGVEVDWDLEEEEGPFGEYTGYVGGRQPRPVFHVTAVTHRTDPILTMTSIGVPVDEDHIVA